MMRTRRKKRGRGSKKKEQRLLQKRKMQDARGARALTIGNLPIHRTSRTLRRQTLNNLQQSRGNGWVTDSLIQRTKEVQRQSVDAEVEDEKQQTKHYGPLIGNMRKLSPTEKRWLRKAIAFAVSKVEPVPFLSMLITYADMLGVTVAVGLGGGGGSPGIGIGAGSGFYVGPDTELGIYGGFELHKGLQLSISGVVQYTIVKGGPENLAGECKFVGAGGDIGASLGGLVLLTMDEEFLGVVLQAGIGAGPIPFEFYAGQQETYARDIVR